MKEGQKHSEETRRKLRLAWEKRENRHAWNKGKKTGNFGNGFKKGKGHPFFGKKRVFTEEWRRNMSVAHKGIKMPPFTEEHKNKIRDANLGSKSHLWRGGVTEVNHLIRTSAPYKEWRTAVYKRDGYACVLCGDDRGGNLQADHIKPFSLFPDLRFVIDNGRTLCIPCHKKTDTYGWKPFNLKKQKQSDHIQ